MEENNLFRKDDVLGEAGQDPDKGLRKLLFSSLLIALPLVTQSQVNWLGRGKRSFFLKCNSIF